MRKNKDKARKPSIFSKVKLWLTIILYKLMPAPTQKSIDKMIIRLKEDKPSFKDVVMAYNYLTKKEDSYYVKDIHFYEGYKGIVVVVKGNMLNFLMPFTNEDEAAIIFQEACRRYVSSYIKSNQDAYNDMLARKGYINIKKGYIRILCLKKGRIK